MLGCYVHVPFCKDICSYCDFTRCRYHVKLAQRWLKAVKAELDEKLNGKKLSTLYIGGGTPSALSAEQLEQLLSMLHPYSKHLLEYTMEANVESLSDEKLAIMKRYGINRVSLGIQTVQENLLTLINRHHNREMVVDALKRIHGAGIHNISADLIYALPQQTNEQWQADLAFLCSCDLCHLSLYSLTIEEHSAFGRQGIQPMDEEIEASMFETAISYLQAHGYEHYEISNFAKTGKRSLHNQIYWNYEDFIGIGCGASGKENHIRYDNTRNLQTYFEKGSSPQCIVLSEEEEMFEHLMMALRMKDGLSLERFYQRHKRRLEEVYEKALKRQISKGMLVIEDGYVHATHRGMLLLNDVLVDYLEN